MNSQPGADSRSSELTHTDLIGRGISQWQQQRPDLDSSGKHVIGRLIHLQEGVLQALHRALQPFNLRYQEYAVLATLRVSGEPYRLSLQGLRETLLYTSGGLSNLLKRLETAEFIVRVPDEIDRRCVWVQLTDAGAQLADAAMPVHAGAELALLRSFSADERKQLASLLARMIGNI